jgi:hypothetical protein
MTGDAVSSVGCLESNACAAVPGLSARERVTVERYRAEHAAEWEAFLAASNNGTLFHDLRFLSYHPPGRFNIHHLLFRRGAELVGILPAGVVQEPDGRLFLKSPYGGSVGGCALPVRQGVETTLALVSSLQEYVVAEKWAGIEMRIGPAIYCQCPNESMGYVLLARGFVVARRWLSHVLALPDDPTQAVGMIPTHSRRRYARYALRQGVTPLEAGADRLEEFYAVLERNRAKHGARPTHSLAELKRLLDLVPGRIRVFLYTLQETAIAGALVLELNRTVAYMFYLCHDERFERYRATSLAVAHVMEQCAARGLRYLDLGPSTFDDLSVNRGLAAFKEEMGGVGFCRDTWRWESAGTT